MRLGDDDAVAYRARARRLRATERLAEQRDFELGAALSAPPRCPF